MCRLLAFCVFSFILVIFVTCSLSPAASDVFLSILQVNLPDSLQCVIPYARYQQHPRPARSFSSSTSCQKWLRKNAGRSLVEYRYGGNESTTGAKAFLDCLSTPEASRARSNIKGIVITFPDFSHPEPGQQSLFDMIQLLPNLQAVSFDCERPSTIRQNFSSWAQQHRPSLYNPSGYPCSDVHRAHNIPHWTDCSAPSLRFHSEYNDKEIKEFYNGLTSCRRSAVKALDFSLSQGGCVMQFPHRQSFPFRRRDGFPQLESLKLGNYDWDARSDLFFSAADSAEIWKQKMDWGKVRELDITRPPTNTFIETFKGELMSLESLTIRPERGFWGDESTFCDLGVNGTETRWNMTEFITSLPPLRSLRLSGFGEHLNLPTILHHHGSTLEHLSIHEFERDCYIRSINATSSTQTRPFLSTSQLEEMKTFPRLRTLELDIFRTSIFIPELTAIAAYPNLSSLTIHLDLFDPNPDKTRIATSCYIRDEQACTVPGLREPVVDVAMAEEMFGMFEGTELRNMTVFVGDYGRLEGGGDRISQFEDEVEPGSFECWWEGAGDQPRVGEGMRGHGIRARCREVVDDRYP